MFGIKKKISQYKRGKSHGYRINIPITDGFTKDETVYILREVEYQRFEAQNDQFIRENGELLKDNKSLKKEIKNLKNDNKTIKQVETTYKEIIEKLNQQQDKTIKELNKNQHETLTELDQQHNTQLNENYDKFNEDLKKYIQIITLQNAALKQILELGFIDMIMNKHKKIAKDQIKELKEDKKVYELTVKK